MNSKSNTKTLFSRPNLSITGFQTTCPRSLFIQAVSYINFEPLPSIQLIISSPTRHHQLTKEKICAHGTEKRASRRTSRHNYNLDMIHGYLNKLVPPLFLPPFSIDKGEKIHKLRTVAECAL